MKEEPIGGGAGTLPDGDKGITMETIYAGPKRGADRAVLLAHGAGSDMHAATLARVIPGVTLERGYAFAEQIHNGGLAIVWSGHRELAEQRQRKESSLR